MGRLNENCVLNIKNKSHVVTAEIDVPTGDASGVIIAQGGEFGGWVVYMREGRLVYCYNLFGSAGSGSSRRPRSRRASTRSRWTSPTTAAGWAAGGTATLLVDGHPDAKGRLEATVPMLFSGDETTDLGIDKASPVSDDYTPEGSRFTGTVRWVRIDLGGDSHDHLITPEQRIEVAMNRQ